MDWGILGVRLSSNSGSSCDGPPNTQTRPWNCESCHHAKGAAANGALVCSEYGDSTVVIYFKTTKEQWQKLTGYSKIPLIMHLVWSLSIHTCIPGKNIELAYAISPRNLELFTQVPEVLVNHKKISWELLDLLGAIGSPGDQASRSSGPTIQELFSARWQSHHRQCTNQQQGVHRIMQSWCNLLPSQRTNMFCCILVQR